MDQSIPGMQELRSANAAAPSIAPPAQIRALRTADYLEKQPLLLVPARLCVRLQEPGSGHGKGPKSPLGLPGDSFQRGLWCLRAAEPISLEILWMGHFPVLLVTARPPLASISSKLLRPQRRIQEEFIS